MADSHEFIEDCGDKPRQSIIYIDSPMPNAVHQVLPFMGKGIFGGGNVALVVRKRSPSLWHWLPPRRGSANLTKVRLAQWEPSVPDNTIIYYPFNAQANVQLVSNRKLRHILVLHGESNKISSYRPASRLYDYLVVAGELACRRYVRANIFTNAEVSGGRLIRMGDSFVQSYSCLRAASADEDGYVLYAPTWETSSQSENYSSAENGFGFDLALDCARALSKGRVILKLHPNYGTRDSSYVRHLVSGLKRMMAAGLAVSVTDDAMGGYVRFSLMVLFGPGIFVSRSTEIPISFAISDISGMEAVLLKQGIAHMVVTKGNFLTMPKDPDLDAIYEEKAFVFEEDRAVSLARLNNYFRRYAAIDAEHRNLIFSYSDPCIAGMSPHDRFVWLEDYIRHNQYWA